MGDIGVDEGDVMQSVISALDHRKSEEFGVTIDRSRTGKRPVFISGPESGGRCKQHGPVVMYRLSRNIGASIGQWQPAIGDEGKMNVFL